MTVSDRDDLERRLRALRERQSNGERSGSLEREIAGIAGRLGFDADEVAAITGQIDPPASGSGHGMAGDYRVLRGAAAPILTFSALVIAGAVAGLGQPVAGAILGLLAVGVWFISGARRVARMRISGSGMLSFPGRLERFDPAELVGVDFAYRYPRWIAEHDKAASETVYLRLRLTGDRSLKLAHGPLWRVSPTRAPVAWYQLERRLLAEVQDAGLTVKQRDGGWTARRIAEQSG